MPTENTSLKNTTPTGDSNTTNKMVIGKDSTYQRKFLILTGSLLALLVWIAVTNNNNGRHFNPSLHEIAEGADALADYQVDTVDLALAKDIFGFGANSQTEAESHVQTFKQELDRLIKDKALQVTKKQKKKDTGSNEGCRFGTCKCIGKQIHHHVWGFRCGNCNVHCCMTAMFCGNPY